MVTINVNDYKLKYGDSFFFDTNIWLLLYANIGNFQIQDQKAYSAFLKKTITKDLPIYISSFVLSEYANTAIRYSYKTKKIKEKLIQYDFKKNFIGSQDYKDSTKLICNSINQILNLPNIIKVSDNFNGIDINNILLNFKSIDFNDCYIAELSLKNKYKIVSNDSDFKKITNDIELITARI